jgi:CheY-like chemotaxis protein
MSRKVLIVDDAVVDRQNLERILSAAGHRVLLAETGEQALLRARADRPDVILMDVNMPDLDGFATTRRCSPCSRRRDRGRVESACAAKHPRVTPYSR